MQPDEKEDTVDECKEDTFDKEVTVGDEILQELSDTRDERHRVIMKEHLRWSLSRVDELKESKCEIDEELEKAFDHLKKISKMTLSEFGTYIKNTKHDYDDKPSRRTVNNNKRFIAEKLKMTFHNKY